MTTGTSHLEGSPPILRNRVRQNSTNRMWWTCNKKNNNNKNTLAKRGSLSNDTSNLAYYNGTSLIGHYRDQPYWIWMYLYFRGFWYTRKLWDWAHIENKDLLKYRHPFQLHHINFISTHKKGPHMKGQRMSTSATQCFVANCIISCRWVSNCKNNLFCSLITC